MDIQEIYKLGLAQGWSEADAYQMALIAWAESAGDSSDLSIHQDKEGNSYSVTGLWQINSIHVPKLIEAGIIIDGEDLLDPTVNAEAANYVGHRMDWSEPWDHFDWTRWSVMKLPLDDGNHPSRYESLLPAPEGVAIDWGSLEGVPEAAVGGDIDFRALLLDMFPGLGELSPEEFEEVYQNALDIVEEHGLAGLDEAGDFARGLEPVEEAVVEEGEETGIEEPSPWWEVDVSNDFRRDIEATPEWQAAIEAMDDAGSELGLKWMYNQFLTFDGTFTAFYDMDESGGLTRSLVIMADILEGLGGSPVSDPYVPGGNLLPMGWLDLWGEDNDTIGTWLDMWVDRFNENRALPEAQRVDQSVLDNDFLHDKDDGLYAQDWWTGKTNNFKSLAEMWYGSYGGPGTTWEGGGDLSLGAPGDWSGQPTSEWNQMWRDFTEIVHSGIEDLGLTVGEIGIAGVNELVLRLVGEGGAAWSLNPESNRNWDSEAAQIVENAILAKYFDDEGNFTGTAGMPYGAGTIKDVEDQLRAHAYSQLVTDIPDSDFQRWAIEIKGEKGLNQSQVEAYITEMAYGRWGLSDALQTQMKESGTTISHKVSPLYTEATELWNDSTILPTDPWLMANYTVMDDQGISRFRSGPEMRLHARSNADRFQYSDEFQNPLNDFMTSAAMMFRSDV